MLFPEWSTAVLFSDSCSWVPCLSWTIKLSAVLQKNHSAPTNYLVFQHFCVFEPFPTMTVWFWDPSFHSEDNWGTHMQVLQKIQMLTDAPEFFLICTCMCLYLYIHNKHTQYTYIYYVNKLLFWIRLIAINRLTALIYEAFICKTKFLFSFVANLISNVVQLFCKQG